MPNTTWQQTNPHYSRQCQYSKGIEYTKIQAITKMGFLHSSTVTQRGKKSTHWLTKLKSSSIFQTVKNSEKMVSLEYFQKCYLKSMRSDLVACYSWASSSLQIFCLICQNKGTNSWLFFYLLPIFNLCVAWEAELVKFSQTCSFPLYTFNSWKPFFARVPL